MQENFILGKLKKGEFSLGLINAAYREVVWGSRSIAPSFLNSALDGGQLSASSPCCFNLGGNSPLYSFYRKLNGPRAGLDFMEKIKKISFPYPESKPYSSVVQSIT
jgi:hypothetical protein